VNYVFTIHLVNVLEKMIKAKLVFVGWNHLKDNTNHLKDKFHMSLKKGDNQMLYIIKLWLITSGLMC